MALKVVTMAEMRLEVLLETERTGASAAEVCRRYGISRQTYYRYRRRYLAEGLAGLEDKSPARVLGASADPELLYYPTLLPEGWEVCHQLEDISRGDRFCDPAGTNRLFPHDPAGYLRANR